MQLLPQPWLQYCGALCVQRTWWPSMLQRMWHIWVHGGERDDAGYLHELLGPEQFEPYRTDFYLSEGEHSLVAAFSV